MLKKCVVCGNFFEAHDKRCKYCCKDCSYKATKASRVKLRFGLKTRKEDKPLEEWIAEAEACGMSYGKYRVMVEVFGKSFDELNTGAGDDNCGENLRGMRAKI